MNINEEADPGETISLLNSERDIFSVLRDIFNSKSDKDMS